MPTLSRIELSTFLPHGDEMCLLSSVEDWDNSSITCQTTTHRNPDNPLRRNGLLGMLAGLEYAAQAMGVHVGLTQNISQHNASIGYLGALRQIKVHYQTFQQLSEPLIIKARLLLEQQMSFAYVFSLQKRETILLEGRASIFIQESGTIP